MIELLSPAGDFDCLKAAVQNGADAVYFGGELFNARASASNFDKETLKEAIRYAKLRNVKINFTLNTLIKDNEFADAIELANFVYSCGADALIIQDLGLAKYLTANFPDLDIHASTQMSIHNLNGVLELEKLGFKRVVLSRELSLNEIQYICNNSNIEIEAFIHGALCISYSGQCLFSSSIGARSGNRGKCAQPCRLPYELISVNTKSDNSSVEQNSTSVNNKYQMLDKGYLLSPRDLCGLKYIPDLIKAGVKCLKIEGRMKNPEYVATVTRIYRKYIDLALSNKPYIIDSKDITELLQAFNRGNFSDGNFNSEPNTNYIFKDKPNNTGLYIGNVSNFNSQKGLITLKANQKLSINDKISTEKEEHKYTISELIKDGKNIQTANVGDTVTIGRMKGNISLGDKVYKLSDSNSSRSILESINKENKKIPLSAHIIIKKGLPISLEVTSADKEDGAYFSMSSYKEADISPIEAISNPITSERVKEQLNKTTDTPFEFKFIKVDLDENSYISKISAINQLRRDCLNDLINQAIKRFEKEKKVFSEDTLCDSVSSKVSNTNSEISLLLNEINLDYDYSKLTNIENIYVPIKYFNNKNYYKILEELSNKGNLYISTPTVLKDYFRNVILGDLDMFIEKFNIKGLVITNPSCINYFDKYISKHDVVANYNFNIFNSNTIDELKHLGINRVTLSPELDKKSLKALTNNSSLPVELIVYGKLPLMNSGYCLLGSSNKCYPSCDMKCKSSSKFYLKDRLGLNFRVVPDNVQTITTIYNSKTTSIEYSDIKPDFVRISVLDESINEINDIIEHVRNDKTFRGESFTKGNFDKNV